MEMEIMLYLLQKYLHKDGTESMIVQVFFKQGVTAPAVREVKAVPAGGK